MNTKNIRFRIILWYSTTLFLATAFIFSSFYFVTQQILYSQVDKELLSHSSKLSEIATRQGIGLHEAILKQQLFAEFSDIPGMVVVLLDQEGSIVQNSLSPNIPFVSYQYLFDRAKESTVPVYINQNISNVPMRFVSDPIRADNTLLGVVLVAHPIEAIQKSLNSLLTTLGIVFALLIVPSILGGRLLANKIMRPISKMSDQMDDIGSEHLEERIETPNTSDEIEKLGLTFNKLLDRLQESFERERQFIGDVAHELKTPVATLRGEIELALSKKRTNEEYKKALDESLIDVNRLSTTMKNILDLAWINADSANFDDHTFDLTSALTELKDLATKLGSPKHITIKGDIANNIVVKGMEDKVSRALLNIIDNAIKYTPKEGTVSISLRAKKQNAIVEITDTGIGITEKELSHVFERFYRGAKTAKTLGSGLGLAITQGIIKAHKGDIDISSKTGKGTVVTISLPLSLPSSS
jgi:heavy metal sensor kinase